MNGGAPHFLERFFQPESVAVVGASGNPGSINHALLANLVHLKYGGKIYPVNPNATEILGLDVFSSVKDIPEPVDLAVISVPRLRTPDIVAECAEAGIPRITVIAGGFSETGAEGREAQENMAAVIKSNGMRAIGPNALSPINVPGNFYVSFHRLEPIKTGGLSLIFQSGLYEPRFDWLTNRFNLRLNKLIDLGNKMDINEVDALTYLAQDPGTRVIGIHLESIAGDGRAFLRAIAEASSRGKRVVVLKSGRTGAGATAALSHTGALVQGNDHVFDGALKQNGAVRADTLEEFFDSAKALERFGPAPLTGNRVFLATVPGGEAVIVTDMLAQAGLRLAEVGPETLARLSRVFPPWDISANPWDLGVTLQFRDPVEVFSILVDAVTSDPAVDALAIQFPPWTLFLDKSHFSIMENVMKAGKPIVFWLAGEEPGTYELLTWFEEMGAPVFSTPEKAVRALLALRRLSR